MAKIPVEILESILSKSSKGAGGMMDIHWGAGAFLFRVENCGLGYNKRVMKLMKIGRESNDSRRH